jgi:hypothetical protein
MGYYHLKSRYYNPELCRFINADSVDVLDEDQNNVFRIIYLHIALIIL